MESKQADIYGEVFDKGYRAGLAAALGALPDWLAGYNQALTEARRNIQELERIHEAIPSEKKPQEAGGTRRPSNQEEQVRALIEVYSSIDEDGWEPDPNFVADIMGIVEQAETAALARNKKQRVEQAKSFCGCIMCDFHATAYALEHPPKPKS